MKERQVGDVALVAATGYVALTAISLIAAHIFLVAAPSSGIAERLARPVGVALSFVDSHWKAVLLALAPLGTPVLRDLIRRLRKAWGMEFDVDLQALEPREKPAHRIELQG